MLARKRRKEIPCTLLECTLLQPPWKTVQRFLKRLKLELPYALAIPLLGIHTKKKKKNISFKDTCIPLVIATLSTIAKV